MAKVLKPCRGTESVMNNAKSNVILQDGELFIECPDSGVGKGYVNMKIGDGVTPYNKLPYAMRGNPSKLPITIISDTSDSMDKAMANIVTNKPLGELIGSIKQAIARQRIDMTGLTNTVTANIETFNQTLAQYQVRLAAIETELNDETLPDSVTNQLTDLKSKTESLRTDLNKLTTTVNTLSGNISTLTTRIANAESKESRDIQSLTNSINTINSRLNEVYNLKYVSYNISPTIPSRTSKAGRWHSQSISIQASVQFGKLIAMVIRYSGTNGYIDVYDEYNMRSSEIKPPFVHYATITPKNSSSPIPTALGSIYTNAVVLDMSDYRYNWLSYNPTFTFNPSSGSASLVFSYYRPQSETQHRILPYMCYIIGFAG